MRFPRGVVVAEERGVVLVPRSSMCINKAFYMKLRASVSSSAAPGLHVRCCAFIGQRESSVAKPVVIYDKRR